MAGQTHSVNFVVLEIRWIQIFQKIRLGNPFHTLAENLSQRILSTYSHFLSTLPSNVMPIINNLKIDVDRYCQRIHSEIVFYFYELFNPSNDYKNLLHWSNVAVKSHFLSFIQFFVLILFRKQVINFLFFFLAKLNILSSSKKKMQFMLEIFTNSRTKQ